jgi:hypothetical protein
VPAAPSLLPTLALRSAVPHADEELPPLPVPPPAACAVLVELGVPDVPEPDEPEPEVPLVPVEVGVLEVPDVPEVPEVPEPDAGAEVELDEEQPVAAIAATTSAAPVSDVRRAACAVKFIKPSLPSFLRRCSLRRCRGCRG